MSTEIHEKIKVRKLFCFFIKYRKFQQFYFRNLFLLFRNSSSIPLRFILLRAFDTAMPVRFRFAPSHCGLSPQPCQFDSASLHLTAGFRRSHASSILLRSISLRAFDTAMPVRFRFAPSHCGLSPYTGRDGPLVLCEHNQRSVSSCAWLNAYCMFPSNFGMPSKPALRSSSVGM
jgi:hypothetical protein